MRSPFLARDPGTFVLMFAVWAALSAISLLLPGRVFDANPVFAGVAALGVREEWWGAAMLLDASLLTWTVWRGAPWVRAGIAVVSAGFWFFFGAKLLTGAAGRAIFSAGGAWDVACSFCLAACAAQWAHTLAPHLPVPPPIEGDQPWT